MPGLNEKIADERRRLRSVRQKLTAAVQQTSGGDPAWVPFYVAVTDYIAASMERLHDQDIKMGDMIRDRADTAEAKVKQGLAELDERLSSNQEHLGRLLEAGAALRDEPGPEASDRFEEVARAYTDYIVASMGHHGATTDLAQSLFSPQDWAFMANITEEATKREQALYDEVTRTTPDNLEVPDA